MFLAFSVEYIWICALQFHCVPWTLLHVVPLCLLCSTKPKVATYRSSYSVLIADTKPPKQAFQDTCIFLVNKIASSLMMHICVRPFLEVFRWWVAMSTWVNPKLDSGPGADLPLITLIVCWKQTVWGGNRWNCSNAVKKIVRLFWASLREIEHCAWVLGSIFALNITLSP